MKPFFSFLFIAFNIQKRAKAQGWSRWSEWTTCSRSCDGGVTYQLRKCEGDVTQLRLVDRYFTEQSWNLEWSNFNTQF